MPYITLQLMLPSVSVTVTSTVALRPLDAGPRINYWFVGRDQLVQYSGTADPASVKLTTNTPARLAGTWDLDASGAGGPVIKVQFDATMIKELKK